MFQCFLSEIVERKQAVRKKRTQEQTLFTSRYLDWQTFPEDTVVSPERENTNRHVSDTFASQYRVLSPEKTLFVKTYLKRQ